MPFLSEMEAKIYDEDKWRLSYPLIYQTKSGLYISAPIGFVTDLASIPRIFQPMYPVHGKHTPAAVIHDYLYSERSGDKRFTRKESDQIFHEAMLELGVRKTKAYLMYLAVRVGGRLVWKNY